MYYIYMSSVILRELLQIGYPANNNYNRDSKWQPRVSQRTFCRPILCHPLKIPLSTSIIPQWTWPKRHLHVFSFSKILLPPSSARRFYNLFSYRVGERYRWLPGLYRIITRRKCVLHGKVHFAATHPNYSRHCLSRFPKNLPKNFSDDS